MRLRFLLCAGFVCAALGHTEQLSIILLNTGGFTGSVPGGWQVKVNRGKPDVSVSREPEGAFLRLRSRASSYGLERSVDVDPAQLPWLTWNWKVTELPRGGDFRSARTDDQAAQVLVAFADRRILTYIWDSTAPKGLMQNASSIPLVRIVAVVAQSGPQAANQWLHEAHNLREDYQRAFGRTPPKVKGIRLQINSQHTGSAAESYFGEVAFRANNQ
ncbi:MAG: DUF3047 domain-containing protein [Bryobacteraceae bacterium]